MDDISEIEYLKVCRPVTIEDHSMLCQSVILLGPSVPFLGPQGTRIGRYANPKADEVNLRGKRSRLCGLIREIY